MLLKNLLQRFVPCPCSLSYIFLLSQENVTQSFLKQYIDIDRFWLCESPSSPFVA